MKKLMETLNRPSNNPSGRPLSDDVTDSIHAAIFEILARSSYQDLSMDRIATKAGISRPALYRRYESVGEATLAALQTKGPIILPMSQSPSVERDLVFYLKGLVFSISQDSAVGRALRGILAAALVETAFQRHFAEFIEVRRKPVLDRLVAWNKFNGPSECEVVADALFGPVLYRLLIRQVPVSDTNIDEIVARAFHLRGRKDGS